MARNSDRKPLSILIVDDEFGLAEMLREMLAELGHQATVAINGRLAIRALEEQPVDVVLTDVMMPVMDGRELARTLRADPRHQRLPIILMTSLASAAPVESGLYEAVLEKPFTPQRFLDVLNAVMAERADGRTSA